MKKLLITKTLSILSLNVLMVTCLFGCQTTIDGSNYGSFKESSKKMEESVQSNDSNAVRSYEITTNNLGYNVSKTYKIYLWMDENVGNSQMGTTFNARIGVVNLAAS